MLATANGQLGNLATGRVASGKWYTRGIDGIPSARKSPSAAVPRLSCTPRSVTKYSVFVFSLSLRSAVESGCDWLAPSKRDGKRARFQFISLLRLRLRLRLRQRLRLRIRPGVPGNNNKLRRRLGFTLLSRQRQRQRERNDNATPTQTHATRRNTSSGVRR